MLRNDQLRRPSLGTLSMSTSTRSMNVNMGFTDSFTDSPDEEQGESAILLKHYDDNDDDMRLSQESTIADEVYVAEKFNRRRSLSRQVSRLKKLLTFKRPSSSFVLCLLPSFLNTSSAIGPPKPAHPTAYLDGIRGLAAVFVVTSHYCALFTPAMLEGWGSGGPVANIENNTWIFQLPLLRIISSGQFMVVLFYVLSGCVLSARGLKLARTGKQSQFASTMASSVFRRWIRLHMPVIVSMFIAFVISRLDWWAHLQHDWVNPAAPQPQLPPAIMNGTTPPQVATLHTRQQEGQPIRYVWNYQMAPKLPTFGAQLWHWLTGLPDVVDPFLFGTMRNGNSGGYNGGGVLWTIPAEWLGSMVVFLVTLGLAWTSIKVRFAIILMITMWSHMAGKWEIASFLSGTMIADLMLNRAERLAKQQINEDIPMSPRDTSYRVRSSAWSRTAKFRTQVMRFFWIALFIVGIYFGTLPYAFPSTSFGFVTLCKWIPTWYHPPERYYLCIGSVLAILALTHCDTLQRFFSTPFMRYLGRISFSLYLLHTQLLIMLGIRVMTWSMKVVGGGNDNLRFGVGFAMCGLIMTPITVWAADLFCRGVDEQSVELARWLAEKLLHME